MTSTIRSPRRSPRRLLRIAAMATASTALVGVLGACNAVPMVPKAFSVNGTSYSKSDFTALAKSLVDAKQFQVPAGATEISAADARVVLGELIRHEATLQFLDSKGIKEDPAFRTELVKQASQDAQFESYPKNLQDLLIELNVARKSLTTVEAPSVADVQKLYDVSPASAGVLCLSHILVKTEAEAMKALARLDKGEKFADVAKDVSTEPGADKTGGALKNGEEDCSSLAELQKSFDPDFMAGAVEAKPGVPTRPVKSSFGYHIILSHPFGEVKDSVMRVIETDPGAALLQGFLFTCDVSVDSAYGRWNGVTATIG